MMKPLLFVVAVAAFGACGGGGGGAAKGGTTPKPGSGSGGSQSMNDTGDPTMGPNVSNTGGGTGGANGGNAGGNAGGAFGGSGDTQQPGQEAPVVFPNLDPDPQQAKSQVDQHLSVARAALSQATPDPDTALREAKEALKIDATSVDAAAYVAFAYYHKKQYDTAELVLDDVFKREAAKSNPGIYYVYGLVYDHTNRPEQATLAFKKAVELNPNFASAWVNVGVHQLQNKQYADAQATFERVTGQFNRKDAVSMTSLGSAYRGHSGDFPPGSGERNRLIVASEAAYKSAISANPTYGPAYFNLALLYLDSDPFPSGGGSLDTLQRLNAAKDWLDKYKSMPGVDMKLYDERTKDVTKLIKRAQKQLKQNAKPAKKGGTQ